MEELKNDIDSLLFLCTVRSPWKMRNVSSKSPWIFCSKKGTNFVANERSYTNVSHPFLATNLHFQTIFIYDRQCFIQFQETWRLKNRKKSPGTLTFNLTGLLSLGILTLIPGWKSEIKEKTAVWPRNYFCLRNWKPPGAYCSLFSRSYSDWP